MGCKSCHGGGWRKNDATGLSGETALGILAAHDKRSGTRLAAGAREGRPLLCQSCHPDPVLNAKGNPALLNLSAAMHGFHAHYLREGGGEVCAHCHPASPTGVTRCLRDNHAAKGLDCRSCHGHLEDHAISLLTHENEVHKKSAAWLLQGLKPRSVDDPAQIKPREPGSRNRLPACHQGGQRGGRHASASRLSAGRPSSTQRRRRRAGALHRLPRRVPRIPRHQRLRRGPGNTSPSSTWLRRPPRLPGPLRRLPARRWRTSAPRRRLVRRRYRGGALALSARPAKGRPADRRESPGEGGLVWRDQTRTP